MKINYLQISNIKTFGYYENIADAPKLSFDSSLNLLVGENGSGKSTALEIINFIFKRVIFLKVSFNSDLYNNSTRYSKSDIRQAINCDDNPTNLQNFSLPRNREHKDKDQKILIEIALDEIDNQNIDLLDKNRDKIKVLAEKFCRIDLSKWEKRESISIFSIEINITGANQEFSIKVNGQEWSSVADIFYLRFYNVFDELIRIQNLQSDEISINRLHNTYSMLGGYRNYSGFSKGISLAQNADELKRQIKDQDYNKSISLNETNEPSIFNFVRITLGQKHKYYTINEKWTSSEAVNLVREDELLKKINKKLLLVGLRLDINLVSEDTWSYSFAFYDISTKEVIEDINFLSAGQKAIIHLIFESYGRGDLMGGLVIIDEPEIHLHYQLQKEYLEIIYDLNKNQKCQYIIVTHSEALISSDTISSVRRLGLDSNRNTKIYFPEFTNESKLLIKILDNTRSAHALFARKIILVEGDSDRYFFQAVLNYLYPNQVKEIVVLDMGGKDSFLKWKKFFLGYGLQVFFIGDFDNVYDEPFCLVKDHLKIENKIILENIEKTDIDQILSQASTVEEFKKNLILDDVASLKSAINFYKNLVKVRKRDKRQNILETYSDISIEIEELYKKNVFILKMGDTEDYICSESKKLEIIIKFCDNQLCEFLDQDDEFSLEIKNIFKKIIG
jgi:predicted ATP-dependent endonuclease of OLD family